MNYDRTFSFVITDDDSDANIKLLFLKSVITSTQNSVAPTRVAPTGTLLQGIVMLSTTFLSTIFVYRNYTL